MLIRGAELRGARVDLRIEGERIAAIAPRLAPRPGEPTRDARGGAVLPGLHDHHLHLAALAASLHSVRCGPPDVADEAGLARALAEAKLRGGWVRGLGYCESVAGPLTRARLDAWRPEDPVRVQHRSGACWMLNGAALAELRVGDADLPGVERDADGAPTGRLFGLDAWLRARLGPGDPPDLAPVGRLLARAGVTGVTDASPANGPEELAWIARAVATGALPQRVHLMGSAALPDGAPGVTRGPRKLYLREHALPPLAELVGEVRAARAGGRAVAFHCVTRSELLFATAALEEAGPGAGDRLEHASIAPPDAALRVAACGATVVTQPHFVFERGDRYLREVAAEDRPWLYRAAGWLAAGVPLAAGSDAPYGEADPWSIVRAATARATRAGAPLGPREALSPERALELLLGAPEAPGGPPRALAAGAPADLVLLDAPWALARNRLARERVRLTLCRGRAIFDAATERQPAHVAALS